MTEPTIKPEPTEAERVEAAAAVAAKYKLDVANGSVDDRTPDHLAADDKTVVIDPDAPVRPDHVPEKFWDAKTGVVNFEAWSTAHKELETKFHQPNPAKIDEPVIAKVAQVDADGNPVVDAEGKPVMVDPPVAPVVEQPKHIVNAQDEYAKDGKLSDATYTTLAAQGLDKPTVDAYIAGQVATAAAQDRMAYDAVDGEENFSAMVKWASENASEAELKAYNLQVVSDDNDVVVTAIKGLYSRFQAEGAYEGIRVSGDASSIASSRFASKQEYDAAMREPSPTVNGKTLYEVDAAYRTSVSKKMAASRKAGIDLFNNVASRG